MKRKIILPVWVWLMCLLIISGCSKEKTKYFAALDTNAWWLYHGVNPVPASQAGQRDCYRFTYDKKGRVVELAFFKAGLASVDPETEIHRAVYAYSEGFIDVAFYDHLGNLAESEDGAAKLRYRLDEEGHLQALYYYSALGRMTRNKVGVFQYSFVVDEDGNVVSAISKDLDGNRIPDQNGVWQIVSEFDRKGRQSKVRFLGPQGEPMTNRHSGIAEIRYAYDEHGSVTGESYFDLQGNPAPEKGTGIHAVRREVNKDGLAIMETYEGIDGKPFNTLSEGYGLIEYQRDERGNIIEEKAFRVNPDGGNSLKASAPLTCIKKKYNEQNRIVEYASYDSLNLLRAIKKTGYAKIENLFNKDGVVITQKFFGDNGQLMERIDNRIAFMVNEYNEQGFRTQTRYFDATGKPALSKDLRVAGENCRYDTLGNLIQRTWTDTTGMPKAGRGYGFATIKIEYDRDGNLIQESYFDETGNPVNLAGKGYAIMRKTYNRHLQLTGIGYFDGAGNPAINLEKGYAAVKYAWNSRNLQEKVWYLNSEGVPCLSNDGVSAIVYSYNDYGDVTEKKFLDTGGQPMEPASNGGIYCYKNQFDAYGNQIQTAYYNRNMELFQPASKDGIARCNYSYDQYGHKTGEAYFDTAGNPCLSAGSGVAGIFYEFDREGNTTKISYYGVDGRPKEDLQTGVASMVYTYLGRKETESRFYNAGGKLTPNKKEDMVARFETQYNAKDQSRKIIYYDPDGKVFAIAEGYAMYYEKTDRYGNVVESRWYNAQGKLHQAGADDYAILKMTYDPWFNLIREEYLGADEMPIKSNPVVEYVYNRFGEKIREIIHDANGRKYTTEIQVSI